MKLFLTIAMCVCIALPPGIKAPEKIAKAVPKPDTVYIKQAGRDRILFTEDKPAYDSGFWISVCAIAISVVAIILPIRASKRADRRATFFKMHELWNTTSLQKSRESYWNMLDKHKDGDKKKKIDLLDLYKNHQEDYYIYESIFDVLSDTATLYFDKSADKKLVAYSFYTFIVSYEKSLRSDYIFYNRPEAHKVKMKRKFYQNISDLKADVILFRASRDRRIERWLYSLKLFRRQDDGKKTMEIIKAVIQRIFAAKRRNGR